MSITIKGNTNNTNLLLNSKNSNINEKINKNDSLFYKDIDKIDIFTIEELNKHNKLHPNYYNSKYDVDIYLKEFILDNNYIGKAYWCVPKINYKQKNENNELINYYKKMDFLFHGHGGDFIKSDPGNYEIYNRLMSFDESLKINNNLGGWDGDGRLYTWAFLSSITGTVCIYPLAPGFNQKTKPYKPSLLSFPELWVNNYLEYIVPNNSNINITQYSASQLHIAVNKGYFSNYNIKNYYIIAHLQNGSFFPIEDSDPLIFLGSLPSINNLAFLSLIDNYNIYSNDFLNTIFNSKIFNDAVNNYNNFVDNFGIDSVFKKNVKFNLSFLANKHNERLNINYINKDTNINILHYKNDFVIFYSYSSTNNNESLLTSYFKELHDNSKIKEINTALPWIENNYNIDNYHDLVLTEFFYEYIEYYKEN